MFEPFPRDVLDVWIAAREAARLRARYLEVWVKVAVDQEVAQLGSEVCDVARQPAVRGKILRRRDVLDSEKGVAVSLEHPGRRRRPVGQQVHRQDPFEVLLLLLGRIRIGQSRSRKLTTRNLDLGCPARDESIMGSDVQANAALAPARPASCSRTTGVPA